MKKKNISVTNVFDVTPREMFRYIRNRFMFLLVNKLDKKSMWLWASRNLSYKERKSCFSKFVFLRESSARTRSLKQEAAFQHPMYYYRCNYCPGFHTTKKRSRDVKRSIV